VAVKVLRSEYTGDPTFLARFRAEAQNAAALSHPHIACVYDYGETAASDGSGETLAYLVMELIEGRALNQVIRGSGGLDTATTLRILGQTASGLAEAHRAGMVHRDVKPGNILVTPAGDVKITDFGIAYSARSVALTKTGQVLGTPQYLSPEQAEGRQATPASDVYALGLIGYECLTGHAAFDGENAVTIALKQVREEPEPLPDDLPARVRTLIRRALAKDPASRFADGAAFLAAVEAVSAGKSIDPGPSTVVGPAVAGSDVAPSSARPRGRRHRAPAGSPANRPPVRRRRSRIAVVLLPLLGLLAGAGIAAMVLQGLAGSGNPPAVAAAEQQGGDDTGVVLEADDFVGRPADEVAIQLAALGLSVQRETRETADAEPGTVVGIRPAGEPLAPGDTVLILVAAAPDVPGDGARSTTAGNGPTSAFPGPTTAEPSASRDGSAGRDEATGSRTGSAPKTPAAGSATPPADAEPEPRDTPTESEEPEEPAPTTGPSTPADPSVPASPSTGSDGAEPSSSAAEDDDSDDDSDDTSEDTSED
jgi:serine/threonine-protein kinase